MQTDPTFLFIVALVALPGLYTLTRVVANAYFAEKRAYLKGVERDLLEKGD